MPKYKLYIGKLPSDIKTADLEDEFTKFGKIVNCDVKRGYGFIEFDDKKDAEDAINEMNDKEMKDSKILVEWARDDRNSNKGPTTKDVCYNCGKKGHCF